METFSPRVENIPAPKNISTEFVQMDNVEFRRFLRTIKDVPTVSITIDWVDVQTARRLKAFLEDSSAYDWKQKRSATIRATQEQHDTEMNVFASGVKWEKV